MVPKKLKPVLVNELVSKNARTIDIGLISCKRKCFQENDLIPSAS